MGRSGALILPVPDLGVLPPQLQGGEVPGVTHLCLAPLDRALLIAQLRRGHGLADAAAEAALREALPDDAVLDVSLGIDNVTNRDYVPATWVTGSAPGRNVKLTLTRSF
ncbi:hypothetical protein D3P06_05435 [Paracoccus aestuarii]|uniref:Uncharacterized protein n=1 Tax=Paracoccus aestuarii TaxID=453842 RepID=A0A418ZZF1_9RHOB|nr:hypothetical protein [Paracoccus aestuarii]RJL05872.1 hypothetical protein D3P06_05435 [Paracoccus aestuarii]WCQ98586.1 hypothetical protein JHW48_11870 [Paracoccus aestuarii]